MGSASETLPAGEAPTVALSTGLASGSEAVEGVPPGVAVGTPVGTPVRTPLAEVQTEGLQTEEEQKSAFT